uniref:Platelet endothelial aggregation receptor 1-like n=1 Tax=Crassostrea virginica TaxID=6565 RepID=A0A8B8BXH9_CRAVI|nr:platelet endothelial aggregation receptor 1-like [Crassostrea virginica]
MFDNSINKCIECPDGHFGPGCIHSCPPKQYGRFCRSTCNCSAEQCNAITGCNMGTTPNYRIEEQNKTLSTEFDNFIISPNSSSSPIARKTVENKNRILVLIAVIGTFISTLLLVAIGFELRTRIILFRREPNYDQENMFCGDGNDYAELNITLNLRTRNRKSDGFENLVFEDNFSQN